MPMTPGQVEAVAALWDCTEGLADKLIEELGDDEHAARVRRARDAMGDAFPKGHPVYIPPPTEEETNIPPSWKVDGNICTDCGDELDRDGLHVSGFDCRAKS